MAALVDADPARAGTEVAGLTVRHVDELEQLIADRSIAIGVIATPATAAQQVATGWCLLA